jgi:dienelactone hydrolase
MSQALGRLRKGSRMLKLVSWSAAALVFVVVILALNTWRQAVGWIPLGETPYDRANRLAEHWQFYRPDGPGPFPAAILLSGCDGVRDNMRYWAEMFVQTGRVALVIDSHTPRKLDSLEAWRLVCAGQALSGAERSGDIVAALHTLANMEDVDGSTVILGASHGGWAAMEFVAHTIAEKLPPGLDHWPEAPGDLLRRVSAVVLLYPYCGILNGANRENWSGAPPTLLILAEKDTIVSTPDCMKRADALRETNASIETVVLPGADHGFDQREKSAFSTLKFDVDRRDFAREAVLRFLESENLL